jgi:WD40 repeat protein/predicted Ser/Thr protein kinase
MGIAAGERVGSFEILAPLGEGAMGEVYKARDVRLERTVAIKVLRGGVAESPGRRQRFKREAKAIASLTHPHICTLYDVDSGTGVDYLVMEYIDGKTLAQILLEGPMPLEQVLRLGAEIADALGFAHRLGIVHRDVKPANVMLTRSGAKLLDFGLAKLRSEGGGLAAELAAPQPQALTAEGTVVGTPAYMAPEQLEGHELDGRADVFALGALLYEMATGKRAFAASTAVAAMAAILSRSPSRLDHLERLSPPAFDRLVRRCLEREADDRWQNATDLAIELRWMAESAEQAAPPEVPPLHRLRAISLKVAAGLALAAAIVLGTAHLARPPTLAREARFFLGKPAEASYISFDSAALSPDGKEIAYVAHARDGTSQLWVRALDSLSPRPLPGTEQARFPFWSHDCRFLGFFAEGRLKRVDTAGGSPQVICDAKDPQGGSWGREGVIVFAPESGKPLHRVSASGGASIPATRLEPKDTGHYWPSFLPDGRHFVFLRDAVQPQDHQLMVGSLDSESSEALFSALSNPVVTAMGTLLYVRHEKLYAQPFDLDSLRVSGEPALVAEQIGAVENMSWHRFEFTASDTGMLAYRSLAPDSRFTWFDRSGRDLGSISEPDRILDFDLSPDGARVSFEKLDPDGRVADLWILDADSRIGPRSRITSRLTFDQKSNLGPRWSPDGKWIAFTSYRSGHAQIFQRLAEDPAKEVLLYDSAQDKRPACWSPDGRALLFTVGEKGKNDLWALSTAEGTTKPLRDGDFDESQGRISPDGRWLAYCSNESGRMEVYVEGYSTPSPRRKVSLDGGTNPRWRGDSAELYYSILTPGAIVVVPIGAGGELTPDAAQELFQVPGLRGFAVDAEGQRFLLNVQLEDYSASPLTVVIGWSPALER